MIGNNRSECHNSVAIDRQTWKYQEQGKISRRVQRGPANERRSQQGFPLSHALGPQAMISSTSTIRRAVEQYQCSGTAERRLSSRARRAKNTAQPNDRECLQADDVVAGKNSPETRVCSRPRPAGGYQNRWNGISRQKRVSLASGRSACWRRGVGEDRRFFGGLQTLLGFGFLLLEVVLLYIHVKWRDAGEW